MVFVLHLLCHISQSRVKSKLSATKTRDRNLSPVRSLFFTLTLTSGWSGATPNLTSPNGTGSLSTMSTVSGSSLCKKKKNHLLSCGIEKRTTVACECSFGCWNGFECQYNLLVMVFIHHVMKIAVVVIHDEYYTQRCVNS